MRSLTHALLIFSLWWGGAPDLRGQPVEQLASAYSGKLAWDKVASTVRFTESGAINFTNAGVRAFIWQVPPEVKHVRIGKGVTVNGAFHSKASVTIAGQDRQTSVIYGTDEQRWSQNRSIKAFTICSFQNFGGVMTISNLTSLNPRGFHVRGWENVVHAVSCDFLDRRGGHHNNSDGFEGGHGSTVHDCYFESGDDIIKVYHNVTVTDTTIKMITNSVPIQLGWGNYSDGAVGTFRNLRVLGSGGRANEGNAIVSGRQGRYRVTVNIDGGHIENPNGTLVSLREDSMTLLGAITNTHIKLKSYAGEFQKGNNLLTVCGSSEKRAGYDCLPPNRPPSLSATQQTFTWTNPVTGGPDWIRDAYILRVGDLYYLTGTRRIASATDEPGKWPGFYLWSSADLLNWKEEGILVSNEQVKWADRNFWAPEIRWHPRNRKFYLSFNARQMKDSQQLRLGMGLAVADKVTGPYTLLTPDAAITDNNDASLFFDDDGQDYVAQTGFNLAPIDLDAAQLSGAKKKVLAGGAAGAWDDAAKINEGSTLLKVNGTYYYFWSCNAWGYFVGYATATNIWGPYTKNPNNPIWGASQLRWREAAGQPATLPFTEVGHGTPFLGPDGRLWISGHGHVIQGGAPRPYDSPRICLDPLDFNFKTGEFRSALSWNPQTRSFNPTSPAAQQARSQPLGSVLEHYEKP